MTLIADSGSTKCDWVILDSNKNKIALNIYGKLRIKRTIPLKKQGKQALKALPPLLEQCLYIIKYTQLF